MAGKHHKPANSSNEHGKGGRTASNPDARAESSKGHGSFGDNAPGLVPPSRLNQGDSGIADDRPAAGGELDFDDDEIYSGRGKNVRMGGTSHAQGADSAPLGPPAEIQSVGKGRGKAGR